MEIYFENEQVVSEELLALMQESARLCLEKEGIPEENCEFSVSFVDREEIKELTAHIEALIRSQMCFRFLSLRILTSFLRIIK